MVTTRLARGIVSEALPETPVVAIDTFGRANGTLGTTEVGSKAWATSQGVWAIADGRATTTGSVSNSLGSTATFDHGDVDGEIQVNVGGEAWGAGVAFRQTGPNTTGYMVVSNTNAYRLYKRNYPAAMEQIASWPRTVVAGETLRVKFEGSKIEAFVNDVKIGEATDATYSGTHHGLAVINNSNANTLDNYIGVASAV